MRDGETWVMVCTEVMARGMDFGGVQGVVNYDFPQTLQSYVHRIGRTGRAGRSGVAITYFTDDDVGYLKPIATMVNQSNVQQAAFSDAGAAKTNVDGNDAMVAAPASAVPDWMLRIKKPGGNRRKQVREKPVGRKGVKAVATGRADRDEAWKMKQKKAIAAAKKSGRGSKTKKQAVDEEGDEKSD